MAMTPQEVLFVIENKCNDQYGTDWITWMERIKEGDAIVNILTELSKQKSNPLYKSLVRELEYEIEGWLFKLGVDE